MRFSTASGALLGAAASVHAASSVAPIELVGNKFFNGDGSQFFIKGVAYQLTNSDPLVDGEQCARDVALMKTLGTNTIRVYHVDPAADHSACMEAFASAGIYTLIDLDTFDTYIMDPTAAAPSWNAQQYSRFAAVMDAFAQYDNVLGFFVGNEDIADVAQSIAAPFIKAAAHDMKAYRNSKKYREIPIGYSAADIAELRPMLQDYLTCGGNEDDNVDFFSLNSYEWCDPSTFTGSGYQNLESEAVDFPVPLFFSETGCNVPGPRLFSDQSSILGPDMNSDWSGAIIYEWIQEENNYGLITYSPDDPEDGPRSGTPIPMTPDFANLKAQWATLNPTGVKSADYNPKTISTRSCPASTASGWAVDGNVPLPTLGSAAMASAASAPSGTFAPPPKDSYTGAAPASTAAGKAKNSSKTSGSSSPSATASGSASGTVSGSASSSSAKPSNSAKSSGASTNSPIVAAGTVLFGVMAFFTFWL